MFLFRHATRYVLAMATLGLTVGVFWPGVGRAAEVKAPVRPSSISPDITDEQVLTTIHKGVEFLLLQKHGDNFENGTFTQKAKNFVWQDGEPKYIGGETALIVYSLLHTGSSTDDSRLRFNSEELKGTIGYLAKLIPQGTYVAGLQANALALIPKRAQTPATLAGLQHAKDYILTAMGREGGYEYVHPKAAAFMKLEMQKVALTEAIAAHQDQKTISTMQSVIAKNEEELLKLSGGDGLPVRHKDLLNQLADLDKKLAAAQKAGNKTDEGSINWQIANAKSALASVDYYLKENFSPRGDLSNGQYGTLGAWAIQDITGEIPTGYWRVSDHFWRRMQKKDGSWPYSADRDGSPAMTAAGVASLFVTTEFTDTELRLQPKIDRELEAGLAKLVASFTPSRHELYYDYAVERVGLASGLKFMGKANWYRELAKEIVKTQRDDGSWPDGEWGIGEPEVATAYALLTLARGRNAVVFNKLQYNGPWNARPRDSANITEWMSAQSERPINWQVVNLQVEPEEWLDAPILLITGSGALNLSAADIAKIKAYVNAGGMVFSTADGSDQAFTTSVQKIAGEVVDGKYEMRELPREHAIFKIWKQVKTPPRMMGMFNGSREVWVHSPVDLGSSWQRHSYANSEHFEVPANLYFYATGMGSLRSKLQSLTVTPSKNKPTRTLSLARVQFAGNWDPEPGAWPRMAKIAQADFSMDLQISTAQLAKLGDVDPKKAPIVHMTGTEQFPVNSDAAAAVAAYCNAGGMIFIDSAGGNGAFTNCALQLLTLAFPNNAPAPIPAGHVLINGKMKDGIDITAVEYRKFTKLTKGGAVVPRLIGVGLNGRYAAVLAEDDLTSGLLGTNTWGIVGYTADSALNVVQNLLLYAADPKAAEAFSAVKPGMAAGATTDTAPATGPATTAPAAK